MKKFPTGWLLIGYGAFLCIMGILGFLSNPEKAKTALLSGGIFGGLSIIWGLIYGRGQRWGLVAALFTLVLVSAAFAWRALASWMRYFEGNPDKLVGAVLVTTMLTVSLLVLPSVIRGLKGSSQEGV